MNKSQLKCYIDIGMGISFCLCFITGLMKWPTKINSGIGQRLLGTILHDYSGLLLGLFFYSFNIKWNWIIKMTKKFLL